MTNRKISFFNKNVSHIIFYFSSAIACTILALSTGCASGGFSLTRKYAGFVNSQNIILRIVLYILTSIVFAVTMLIDLVVFNTLDFWDGKVSQGTYNFKDKNNLYVVNHVFLPTTHLRQSTIVIKSESNKIIQEIILTEIKTKEIEMRVDGVLRARVKDISSIPIAYTFDMSGKILSEKTLHLNELGTAKYIVSQK